MPHSLTSELAIFAGMRNRIKNILALSLLLQWVLVRWAASSPQWVEKWYSRGLYPYLSGFFRRIYGWIPFSVGDLVYLGLLAFLLWWLFRKLKTVRRRIPGFLRDLLAGFAILHGTFYLLWGLNYFREPLGAALGMSEEYSREELLQTAEWLAARSNALQETLAGDTLTPVRLPYSQGEIREMTVAAYQNISGDFPEFTYRHPSLKNSLISTALTYMGYGGYLNPFTGEAQVNGRLPLFRYPVVCGHEVGHQLGYSAENETNFIGYLVTQKNPDPYFQYAASAYGLGYCLAEINRVDSLERKRITRGLHPGVRSNYAEMQEFWGAYENPLEPVFKAVFSKYLEANRQADGIASYNRVVSLLVAYHRRELEVLPGPPPSAPAPED
ncbi:MULTISPECIES: DUF3810 domain-containing protein [unclassified Robiginitalea]|uniref:DUF3810 domain-containing protein n=1 Tax=Robiginitalea TaxID=252306 RepID=UPI00234A39B2|nr:MULTISPECIES: DUF3810 domain-containing protein [unclassified Robiginitalea]MDC6354807.1 DUF3810 domain-containing protein [Robiginitalea sp. PM2]MDC6375073.1 DUF3810 domain-containing protein [Robiginitalea sp. SP8]